MGWRGSIPGEILGLVDVLWEVLDHNSWHVILGQTLDELCSYSFVILASETISSQECVEVDVLGVGPGAELHAEGGFAGGLGTEHAHHLRDDGCLSLSKHAGDISSGIDVLHFTEHLVVVDNWE